MNILLAEDDERLGKLVTYLLQKEFHHVDWVKNGSDALSYSSLSEYDVIILDWMKIDLSRQPSFIQNVRGIGYKVRASDVS